MAALSWEEIVERGKQHNKTVICEVEKTNGHRYFSVICDICNEEKKMLFRNFDNCNKCYNQKVILPSKENFYIKSTSIHGYKYDYSLVEYVNSYTKIKIKCNSCDNIFEQTPNHHLAGRGCKNCSFDRKKTTQEEFLLRVKIKHENKYDYSLVEYVDSDSKIKIKCNSCNNIFEQIPHSHLAGHGCANCSFNRKKTTQEEFLSRVKIKHENKYDYNLVEYVNTHTKVKIKCITCENIFEQTPHSHLAGQGCPKCNESKGEIKVAKYLSEKNISFIPQKTFESLRYLNPLKCDFYISEINGLIEYDGEGHYFPCFGYTPEERQKNLEDTQRRDKVKNEWAKANNIPLLRIPYWDYDRIEELIDAFILEHTRKKEVKQLVLEM